MKETGPFSLSLIEDRRYLLSCGSRSLVAYFNGNLALVSNSIRFGLGKMCID